MLPDRPNFFLNNLEMKILSVIIQLQEFGNVTDLNFLD